MDPRDASHPDHRDFQKIYVAVAQSGRWDAKQSGNIASHVLADFKAGPTGLRLDVVAGGTSRDKACRSGQERLLLNR